MTKNFELKKEHVKLIQQLNFKVLTNTVYGDKYIPAISDKRPFGNSGATRDVLYIIGKEPDEEGNFSQEDIDEAETLLIELPAAMEVVMQHETFTPGTYQMDQFCAWTEYVMAKNYKMLRPAVSKFISYIQNKYDGEKDYMAETVRLASRSIMCEDPEVAFKSIFSLLEGIPSEIDRAYAVEIFKDLQESLKERE